MFDYDTFMETLIGKGASGSCPSCGGDRWRHGDHLLALRRHGDTQHIRGGGELVAAYFCENCGFARLHATGESES